MTYQLLLPNPAAPAAGLRALAAALLLATLAGCVAVRPQAVAPSAPPSQSVAEADRKLAQVARERALAEAAFGASEQSCYAKFLVNNCLDAAREKRRGTLARLRAIEIEAEYFKRKAAADERDRALAQSEREFEAEQARLAAEPPPAPREAPQPAPPQPAAAAADRVSAQEARLKRLEAQEQAGAAKRAANVAAFEKRKRESERRQREIEEKKKQAEKKAAEEAHQP